MGGGGNGKNQATAGEFEGINMKVDAVPAGQCEVWWVPEGQGTHLSCGEQHWLGQCSFDQEDAAVAEEQGHVGHVLLCCSPMGAALTQQCHVSHLTATEELKGDLPHSLPNAHVGMLCWFWLG